MSEEHTTLPSDIVDEINRIAVTEEDRIRLTRLANDYAYRPQLARAHIALSEGSMAHLLQVFKDHPYLDDDDRDILNLAHQRANYDSGYFLEPFDVIRQRPKRR